MMAVVAVDVVVDVAVVVGVGGVVVVCAHRSC